jgi:hypothetical protein
MAGWKPLGRRIVGGALRYCWPSQPAVAAAIALTAGVLAGQPAPAPASVTVSAGALAHADGEATAALFNRSGVYVYLPDRDQSAIIEVAINRAVAGMFPVVRDFARQRLMSTNELPDSLRLIVESDALGTQLGHHKPMTLPRSGAIVKWDDGRGNVCRARDSVAADTLFQLCSVGTASSVARFVLVDEGRRLLMVMHIASPRLSSPVQYAIDFWGVPSSATGDH